MAVDKNILDQYNISLPPEKEVVEVNKEYNTVYHPLNNQVNTYAKIRREGIPTPENPGDNGGNLIITDDTGELLADINKASLLELDNEPQLIPGPQGEKGEKGDPGPPGPTGPRGPKGDTVTIDIEGNETLISGPKGDKGDPGEQGPEGPQGPKGDKGDTVVVNINGDETIISGPKGDKGDKGDKGERGPKGDEGPEGPQGIVGPKGSKGDKGEKGDIGPQGPKGDKGDPGIAGLDGSRGPMGPQGPKGDKGDTGDQGSKGDKGDKGDTGPQGPQGIQGPQGLKGDKGDKGDRGPQGATGTQGPQGLKGDKGDKGDTGPQGPQGIQGPQGERGPQGYKGEKGDTGATGTQGPKGDKGDKGDKGERGPQGLKGDKGDKGDRGPQGATGATGDQGPAGPVNLTNTKDKLESNNFALNAVQNNPDISDTLACKTKNILGSPTISNINVVGSSGDPSYVVKLTATNGKTLILSNPSSDEYSNMEISDIGIFTKDKIVRLPFSLGTNFNIPETSYTPGAKPSSYGYIDIDGVYHSFSEGRFDDIYAEDHVSMMRFTPNEEYPVGKNSFAFGRGCVASGDYSHAEGEASRATSYAAHAENRSGANGDYSHSEGIYSQSNGDASHSEGNGSYAIGDYSHAEGSLSQSNGDASHSEGNGSYAIGDYSHAEGKDSHAIGKSSHAEGSLSQSNGAASHSEGNDSHADGDYSHAEGGTTKATGGFSHSEGLFTEATGLCAHAEGYHTVANGSYSHTAGDHTYAYENQCAIGLFNSHSSYPWSNTNDVANTLFYIGNGLTENSRSNAMRVDTDGKIWCKAAYSSTGADYAELFEWEDGNPNNEDRRGYFVTMNGEKIKIASSGDWILGIVSGHPCVLGNTDTEWNGRFMKDEFGSYIKEPIKVVEKVPVFDKEGNITEIEQEVETEFYKTNPDYDPNAKYTDRLSRPEWDAIGMMGVLSVYDDGTCKVNGFCEVKDGGIATSSKSGYRVIARLTDNIIKVVFK